MPVAKHPLFAIGIPPANAGRAPPGRRPVGRAGRPLRSASVVVGRVTAEPFLVSAQGHHLVELSDAADNHSELAAFFCLPRRALQASDALEQQVTLIDYVVNVYPTSWSPSDNTAFPFETLSTSCELLVFSLP